MAAPAAAAAAAATKVAKASAEATKTALEFIETTSKSHSIYLQNLLYLFPTFDIIFEYWENDSEFRLIDCLIKLFITSPSLPHNVSII
jgi:uncharacterized membrane protein (GlpM family)